MTQGAPSDDLFGAASTKPDSVTAWMLFLRVDFSWVVRSRGGWRGANSSRGGAWIFRPGSWICCFQRCVDFSPAVVDFSPDAVDFSPARFVRYLEGKRAGEKFTGPGKKFTDQAKYSFRIHAKFTGLFTRVFTDEFTEVFISSPNSACT